MTLLIYGDVFRLCGTRNIWIWAKLIDSMGRASPLYSAADTSGELVTLKRLKEGVTITRMIRNTEFTMINLVI